MRGKKAFWILLTGLLFLVFLERPAFCVTLYVPDNYPTIQAAVDATWGGETIIVRAGTYRGEGNKNITISKIITVKSENGPENTIIDCEGAGRGVSFTNVSNLAVLDGFTIINGKVTGANYGGGIYCWYASPQINNCIINDSSASYGGGIYSQYGSPSFSSCIINHNSSTNSGGGIYAAYGTHTFNNSTISNNTAASYAGGIHGDAGSFLSLSNCVIKNNTGVVSGGGISSANSISCTNCAILSNKVINGYGGGIDCNGTNSFTNCTFAWNSAWYGGGINSYYSSTIRNSLFYFDSALQEINLYSGAITITHSNIMGGYAGEGNIDENPGFVAGGDFHLSASSPCIDTASPDNAPALDLDGEVRPHGDGVDMGADEFDGIPAPLKPNKADLNDDGAVDGQDVAIFAEEYGRTE